jgi:hypothetical protein
VKLIACCVLAVALSAGACKRGPDISDDPAIIGQTITVSGKVEKVHQPNLLEVKTNRGDLLVFTTQPSPELKAGQRVSVTGDVRRLTIAEIERDYAMDVEAPIEVRLQEENFVAASAIKPA